MPDFTDLYKSVNGVYRAQLSCKGNFNTPQFLLSERTHGMHLVLCSGLTLGGLFPKISGSQPRESSVVHEFTAATKRVSVNVMKRFHSIFSV